MKSQELVNKAKDIAKNYKTLYVMGCFGSPMTDTNKKRYCENNDYNKQISRTKIIKNASNDTFGFDCVCLIKGILWGWSGNKTKTYGGAIYKANGVADVNADVMCSSSYSDSISKDFNKIQIGELLAMKGHVGIYIGDGLAVECSPAWQNKVQITAVKNIGTKVGYNARTWTSHCKLKYIDYANKKTIDEIAQEVLDGLWGNGTIRKSKLIEYGYNYNEIQAKVNDILAKQKEKIVEEPIQPPIKEDAEKLPIISPVEEQISKDNEIHQDEHKTNIEPTETPKTSILDTILKLLQTIYEILLKGVKK